MTSQDEDEKINTIKDNLLHYSYDMEDFSVYTKILLELDSHAKLSEHHSSDTYVLKYTPLTDRESIVDFLALFENVTRVAIAFHGPHTGASSVEIPMFLSYDSLFTEEDLTDNVVDYSVNVTFMKDMISSLSLQHLDFLGCNLLSHDIFKSYFSVLSNGSTVVIGASDDNTGNLKHGGNWVLESTMENIKDIYFTDSISNYATLLNVDGGGDVTDPNDATIKFNYTWYSDGTARVNDWKGSNTHAVIPSTIEVDGATYTVDEMRYVVFNGDSVTKITIPSTVTTWATNFILNGWNLEEYIVDANSTALKSESGVLMSKDGTYLIQCPTKLASIVSTKVFDMTQSGFSSVTRIRDYAFQYNSNLQEIILGNTLTQIDNYALNQSSLHYIDIPSNVTTLGNYTFQNCHYLSYVRVKSTVYIGNQCFYGSSLHRIDFHETPTNLGTDAFNDCRELNSISFLKDVPTRMYSGSFNRMYAKPFIKFPSVRIYAADVVNYQDGGAAYLNFDGGLASGYSKLDYLEEYAWKGESIIYKNLHSSQDNAGACSISSDGNFMAYGLWGRGDGVVRVYQQTNVGQLSWTQIGGDITTTLPNGSDPRFGTNVSLSNDGQTVAVGAYNGQHSGVIVGTVEVFSFNSGNSTWELKGDAKYGTNKYSNCHVVSLSGDGNFLVVGEPSYDTADDPGDGDASTYTSDNNGRARIFDYNSANNTWDILGNPILGSLGDELGKSVAINRGCTSTSNAHVVIGSIYSEPSGDGNHYKYGSAKVYTYDSVSSDWTLKGEVMYGGQDTTVAGGYSVSISSDGSVVAFSCVGDDNNSTGTTSNAGNARIYEWRQFTQSDSDNATYHYTNTNQNASQPKSLIATSTTSVGSSSGTAPVVGSYYWTQKGKDIDGEEENERLGEAISLNDDGSIIGITSATWQGHFPNGDKGRVTVYKYSSADNSWSQYGDTISRYHVYQKNSIFNEANGPYSYICLNGAGDRLVYGDPHVDFYDGHSWSNVGAVQVLSITQLNELAMEDFKKYEDFTAFTIDLGSRFPTISNSTYTVTTHVSGIIQTSVSGDTLTVSSVSGKSGNVRIDVSATGTDSNSQSKTYASYGYVNVVPVSHSATISSEIADQSLTIGASDTVIDLSALFSSADETKSLVPTYSANMIYNKIKYTTYNSDEWYAWFTTTNNNPPNTG